MPSLAKVVKVEESGNEFLAVVKVRGVGTKNFNSPVAKRAKFAAAREVGILSDYVPNSLQDISEGENINALMEGEWAGEIVNVRDLDDDEMKPFRVQQTVLYGIKLSKTR